MKKKILSLMVTAVLCLSTCVSVFADANVDAQTGIAPTAISVAQLNTTTYSNVFTGNVPETGATPVVVTNNVLNPGPVYVRVIDSTGRVIGSERYVGLGGSTSFTITSNPTLPGTQTYTVQSRAATTNGTYSIYVNQGTVGDDLITIQLNEDQWSFATRLILPTELPIPEVEITIANHEFSPSPIVFTIIDPETGIEIEIETEDTTLNPGEEAVVTANVSNGATAADVFVQSIGTSGETYIISASVTAATPPVLQ